MPFKFERFETWVRATDFAEEVFKLADEFPQRVQFSLGEQLRRASLSVPTNLAEGSGRDSPKEQAYFYRVAEGSLYEVVSLLVIAGQRGILAQSHYRQLYQEADELAAIFTGAIRAANKRH